MKNTRKHLILAKLQTFTPIKVEGLYLRRQSFLKKFLALVVAGFYEGFILSKVPGILAFAKFLAPTLEGVFLITLQAFTLVLLKLQGVAEFVFSQVTGF